MAAIDDEGEPFVHASAIVEDGAMLGAGTRVWHHAHVRSGARLGARCVLGKGVFVDRDVVIGDGVHIQNNVSVYSGVELDDEVFVGPSAVFTNDRVPRAGNDAWHPARTLVRRGASIGANATLLPGIVVGRWALVGAGSVVTGDVDDHQVVVGNPARVVALVCRCGAVRERLPTERSLHCDSCGTDLDAR